MPPLPSSPRFTLVLLALIVAAVVVCIGWWGWSYDDNFITYRYADNLSRGQGLVFNPGERVLGTTAPGYAVLLAALAWITAGLGLAIGVPEWGTIVAAVSLVVVAGLFALALRRCGHSPLPALGFAMLSFASRVDLHLLGAEAFPVLALVIAAAWLLSVRKAPWAAGVAIGLAMAFRLDAGIAATALGLVEWHRRRRFPIAFAATGMGIVTGWMILLWSYFGQVVPNTLGGKKALAEVPYSLREWQTIATALPLPWAVVLLLGVVLGLAVIIREGWWRHPIVLALGIWIMMHEVVYRAIGVWFAPWYFLHTWHALLALYALAAGWLAAKLGARQWLSTLATATLLAPVMVPAVVWAGQNWRTPIQTNYAIYRAVGEHLAQHTEPGATVLALEIGIVGYFGERPILDYGALVSPRFTAAKFAKTRPGLAVELAPDVIVAITGNLMIGEVLEQPEISERYIETATFEDAHFMPGSVTVWTQAEASTRTGPRDSAGRGS